jgi:hypothetical protein
MDKGLQKKAEAVVAAIETRIHEESDLWELEIRKALGDVHDMEELLANGDVPTTGVLKAADDAITSLSVALEASHA